MDTAEMYKETQNTRFPTTDESQLASKALNVMSSALDAAGRLSFTVKRGEIETLVTLPNSLANTFVEILTRTSLGEMVTIVPYSTELSTQKAADLLNVSRPFLVQLLERGELKFHRTGTHRRIVAEDLLQYRDKRDRSRSEGMARLQNLSQEYEAE